MRRIFSALVVFSFFAQMIPLIPAANADGTTYIVSAYYSPKPGQDFYLHKTYDDEIAMNGAGIRTSSGEPVRIGAVAAPKDIQFQTRVRIKQTLTIKGQSVNFEFNGTVLDRGGAIHSANNVPRLDIYMGEGQAWLCRAINFGFQTVFVNFDTNATPVDTTNLDMIPSNCNNPHNEIVPLASGTTLPFDPFTMPIGVASPVENIKTVQGLLSRVGTYTGPIDGILDADVTEAIIQFQIANGIIQTRTDDGAGTYGPKTRSMLKVLLSGTLNTTPNSNITNTPTTTTTTPTSPTTTTTDTSTNNALMSNDDTRDLEKKLKDLGYFNYDIDGIYNKHLVDSIYAFQTAKKIVTSVDDPGAGYYGSVTQTTLDESYAAYTAKHAQIVALETQLDTAKQTRDAMLAKKQQEFVDTMKKIPAVRLNQVHPEIRTLQKILKQVGYLDAKDTAIFGKNTKSALAKYQLELRTIDSLTSQYAGVLGDKTRAAIAADLYARWLKTDTTSNVDIDKIQKQLDDLKKS